MTGGAVTRALRIAAVTVVVGAYPFLLVTGLDHLAARTIGAGVLAIVLAAALAGRSRVLPLLVRRFGLLVVVLVLATATDEPVLLKLLPSLTSLWLLASFGLTLRSGPSMVGQFAISMHDGFPDFLLPYCRRVTWVWCGFFFANAVVGIALAVFASPQQWALYTGVVSYVLIALLAAGEYVFHKSRFRFYENGWADGIWRKICPPERTELGRRTLHWQISRQHAASPGMDRHRDAGVGASMQGLLR